MRSTYLVILTLLFGLGAFAKTATLKELLTESAVVKKKIVALKSFDERKSELKKWETKLQITMKSYENKNPTEGSAEEDLVVKLFLSMEPVFDLVKEGVSPQKCKKAQHQIELEDKDMTKSDPAQLSIEAKEALSVLNLFCVN